MKLNHRLRRETIRDHRNGLEMKNLCKMTAEVLKKDLSHNDADSDDGECRHRSGDAAGEDERDRDLVSRRAMLLQYGDGGVTLPVDGDFQRRVPCIIFLIDHGTIVEQYFAYLR